MSMQASGSFQVRLTPLPADDESIGRMAIDKEFHGDLEATSTGQMLSAMTEVRGSAGYVAIECVSGSLHGKEGSFILQHSGTMHRGEGSTTVTVVPDSGTDELTGISGTMTIVLEGGKHAYEFDYTLE